VIRVVQLIVHYLMLDTVATFRVMYRVWLISIWNFGQ